VDSKERVEESSALIFSKFLKSKSALGFVVTTLFNFISITLLLWVALKIFKLQAEATILAQVVGLVSSMVFTLDYWWSRVSKEIESPIKVVQRVKFLGIGGTSALVSWLSVYYIAKISTLSDIQVIFINWFSISLIAVLKYVLFVRLIQK
jgi:hypothetical protein